MLGQWPIKVKTDCSNNMYVKLICESGQLCVGQGIKLTVTRKGWVFVGVNVYLYVNVAIKLAFVVQTTF